MAYISIQFLIYRRQPLYFGSWMIHMYSCALLLFRIYLTGDYAEPPKAVNLVLPQLTFATSYWLQLTPELKFIIADMIMWVFLSISLACHARCSDPRWIAIGITSNRHWTVQSSTAVVVFFTIFGLSQASVTSKTGYSHRPNNVYHLCFHFS